MAADNHAGLFPAGLERTRGSAVKPGDGNRRFTKWPPNTFCHLNRIWEVKNSHILGSASHWCFRLAPRVNVWCAAAIARRAAR